VAENPKRTQPGKGRQQQAKRGQGPSGRPSRKAARVDQEQARAAHEGNGQEDLPGSENMEQYQSKTAQFARETDKQFRQAAGAAPQVLGWTSAAPAKQLENMMTQLWNIGGDGGSGRYMRALAQANVEMVGLFGRRSRAYLDLPGHLAQCRTPQQMLDEQARFFQDMVHDYQVTNDRVMSCWMEAATPFAPEEGERRARKS